MGIGGIESVDIGQKDEKVCPNADGNLGGEGIVIAEDDLGGGNGIVLVDDG